MDQTLKVELQALQGHGFSRAAKWPTQIAALAAGEVLLLGSQLSQRLNRLRKKGTTLVVPQDTQNKYWALAPEARVTKTRPESRPFPQPVKPRPFRATEFTACAILCGAFLIALCPPAQAQRAGWRQASDAELASLLPARAPVEREHIETELRTASGIVNSHGHFIAGVVLITAGYSADGKYSHYLIVQEPIRIGGINLKPGEYVFGWVRSADALSVHFHSAATGALVGTTDAHRLAGSNRVESLHIWPPSDKALIQIGRFGIPYELREE